MKTTTVRLLGLLVFTLASMASYAQSANVVTLQSTIKGTPITQVMKASADPGSLAQFKAQSHLPPSMTQQLLLEGSTIQPGLWNNGTANTLPYFTGGYINYRLPWFKKFSTVGHSPSAGGTTFVSNRIIPLITYLYDSSGNLVYVFDPTVANDPQGSDVDLVAQSPLYDATTTYPGGGLGGLPPDSGQIVDTNQRAEMRQGIFAGSPAANWHTVLSPPASPTIYAQKLFYNNGDWGYVCCDKSGKIFPVVNIVTEQVSIFPQILTLENPPNNELPIILTDYVTLFVPSPFGCCILGFHTAQTWSNPLPGILVWAWATFLPHSNDPFAPSFQDITPLSHEVTELFNNPFLTNSNVDAWVDGSGAPTASTWLETGDPVEVMSAAVMNYPVPLSTTGGPYSYHPQNEALLEWFTRWPLNGATYSWPNVNTLSAPHALHPCSFSGTRWLVGQGSAGYTYCTGVQIW